MAAAMHCVYHLVRAGFHAADFVLLMNWSVIKSNQPAAAAFLQDFLAITRAARAARGVVIHKFPVGTVALHGARGDAGGGGNLLF